MKKYIIVYMHCLLLITFNLHEATVNIVLLYFRSQSIEKENWNNWLSQKDKQYRT